MQTFVDPVSAAPLRAKPARAAEYNARLAKLETWVTTPEKGSDGWGHVKACVLVRVTTETGVSGWGEAFVVPHREAAVVDIIHALGGATRALETVSPWAFQDLATRLGATRIRATPQSLEFAAASSALEIALWDICGKLAGKPLCDLFGGDHTRAIQVYGNIWSESQWNADALAARAAMLVGQGYRAVKIHPMLNHSVAEAARCVAQVRGAIGGDIALMVDLDGQDDLLSAQRMAELIAPAHPFWLEEPVDGNCIQDLVRLREGSGLKIVTGEKQCGQAHYRAVLAGDAADILNPDIAGLGGLLDYLEVAALADQHRVKVSPHCWNSMTVAAAAMLHVCAAIPNPEMAEIYPEYIAHGSRFAATGFWLDGAYAYLSDKPGLGVDIDVSALRSLSDHYRSTHLSRAGIETAS